MVVKLNSNGYATDHVKAQSREMILQFANERLPRDRTNATAIYLASTNDRESILLDKLGIPRGNRIILESDQEKVNAVMRVNPGVQVLPMSTHEFFKSEAQKYQPWWYCGLDYECLLNEDVLGDLGDIREKRLLVDGGVIYTNLVGQREQTGAKETYVENLFRYSLNTNALRALFGKDYRAKILELIEAKGEEIADRYRGQFDFNSKLDPSEIDTLTGALEREALALLPSDKLDLLRDHAMSATIRAYLSNNRFFIPFRDFATPGTKRILESFGYEPINCEEDNYRKDAFFPIPIGVIFNAIVENNGKYVTPADSEALVGKFEGASKDITEEMVENSVAYFRKGKLNLIPLLFQHMFSEGYSVVSTERFSYGSSRRTNMMLDVMQVRRLDPLVKGIIEWICQEDWQIYYASSRPYLGRSRDEKIMATSTREAHRIMGRDSDRLHSILEDRIGFLLDAQRVGEQVSWRRYLGNASLPSLGIAIARKLVLEGLSNDEIGAQYYISSQMKRRLAALRANATKGTIKKPKNYDAKPKPRTIPKKEKKSRYLIDRSVYRALPEDSRLRVDYFVEETLGGLHHIRRNNIWKAFRSSNLDSLIDPQMDPMRLYAFFDDVALAIMNKSKISSGFLNQTFKEVRDAPSLTSIVTHESDEVDTKPSKTSAKILSDQVKGEVRELFESGADKEEIWETYKQHFSSRSQFGSVLAWSSPKLAKKRKKT